MTDAGCALLLARLQALHPRTIDLSLDRMWRLLAALGHPERRLPPVVHIAGTNGKGSTLAILHAVLEAAGLVVHRYVSPHLVEFRERILLAGRPIAPARLADLLARCERANAGRPVTFFEITTAAALLAFAETPADVVLLETGLGGRLDATNVVPRPRLVLIAPIGRDHERHLGRTVREIAFEKAGILRPDVPVLVGRQRFAEAVEVLEHRASLLGAPLSLMGRDFEVTETADGLRFRDGDGALLLPRPALAGVHQIDNAGLAVAAARRLARDFPGIDTAALAAGLRRVHWPARLQRLTEGPLVARLPRGFELWLDGGHNPDAGEALARSLDGIAAGRPVHLVVGMLAAKDLDGFLAPLATRVRGLAFVPVPDDHRGHDPHAAAARWRARGTPARAFPDVAAALAALPPAGPGLVLVCGSLYLAGAVLRENRRVP